MSPDGAERAAARRVVVVDDDPATRELLATILADEGYEVSSVASGEAALEVLKAGRPDLVLLDLRLPWSDGAAFAHVCRQTFGPAVPIVVVTGAPRAAEQAAELGADAFLQKPFDLEDLLNLANQLSGRDDGSRG